MSQLLRVQNFGVSIDGSGAGEGQSLEEPFGHADRRGGRVARLPADLVSWAGATASWAEPNRARRIPRAGRLLHSRLHAEHRCRDHGPQQVRAAAWPVGEPSTGRGGGETPRPSTPPCSSSPTITDPASRWPTPRSTSSMRRPRKRCGKPTTPLTGRTYGLEAASPLFGSSSRRISSTPSMSPSRRSKSAEGSDSGPPTRTCSTGSTSSPCPAPAALRTSSSGGGNHGGRRAQSVVGQNRARPERRSALAWRGHPQAAPVPYCPPRSSPNVDNAERADLSPTAGSVRVTPGGRAGVGSTTRARFAHLAGM